MEEGEGGCEKVVLIFFELVLIFGWVKFSTAVLFVLPSHRH